MTTLCRSRLGVGHALGVAVALGALVAAPAGAGERLAAVAHPVNVVSGISVSDADGGVELAIRGSRAPSYTVFKLSDPPRLVVDLAGADVSAVSTPVAVGRAGVREVTTAQYSDARSSVGRVVVGLEAHARYEVAARDEAVVVKVTPRDAPAQALAGAEPAPSTATLAVPAIAVAATRAQTAAQAEAAEERAESAPSEDHVVARRIDEGSGTATSLLSARAGGGEVKLELDGEAGRFEVIELRDPPRLAIDLFGLTRAPGHPVSLSGDTFRQARFGRDAGKVRVVLDAGRELPEVSVKRVPGGLAIVTPSQVPTVAARVPREAKEAPVRVETARSEAAGQMVDAAAQVVTGAVQRRETYTGRRITLDFHDIEIRNLLRLIADVSKKNIVVADDVAGKVTVSLRNVPWDQALDLVLRTKGLDKEEIGNVIRVAKAEEIAKEQQARLEAAKARIPLLPLKVRIIPVNFARASEVAPRVKDVLSDRGSVTTDDRTNVLIVKDVQEALSRAEGLVRNLDTEIPQVRIESRIVEASTNFSKAIGVQWGGNATFSPATGNPTGLFFPNIASAAGASGGGPTTGTAANPGYAVNLPAAIGQGSGGGIGFQFGSAGSAFNLNLRLSALETTGAVKTISAPSVSTIDNREATIGQGLSIPFSQVSASGVNTVFVEAKLELKVTPHVSADGSVLMKIKVTNNSPNPQLTGANGQPSISKREAETEALVKDGETTVIGGIYTRQTATSTNEVPFLGKIPILGFFFRNKSDSDQNTELLVFITPRIINRQATTAATSLRGGQGTSQP